MTPGNQPRQIQLEDFERCRCPVEDISSATGLPLVSIVTPLCDHGPAQKLTIDSVLKQTYPNIEHVVINGSCTDRSQAALEAFITWFRQIFWPTNGYFTKVNAGLARSRGEIISVLHPGDVLFPDAVEKVVGFLEKHPECDLVYGQARLTDEQDLPIGVYEITDYSLARMMKGDSFCPPAAFWRAEIGRKLGPFNHRLVYAPFYEYWMRLDRAGGRIGHFPGMLLVHRVRTEPTTFFGRFRVYRETHRTCQAHAGYVDARVFLRLWDPRGWEQNESLASLAFLRKGAAYTHFACHWVWLNAIAFLARSCVWLKAIAYPARSMKRRLKRWLSPRLGKLNQYPAKPLMIPKRYNRHRPLKSPPTISIVTPSFNQGRFITRTIQSVLDQGYSPLEYIVQDGGSTDETVRMLEFYQSRLFHWESVRDEGQADAINKGFRHASGEIMAYLNSDDLLLPGTLHYVAKYFARHPEVDVVYGHRVVIDEHDAEVGRWVMPCHNDDILSWADYVPQETLFWRRRIWEKVGAALDESFDFALDWDLLLRFRDAGARFVRLPRFLGAFRLHPEQKSSACMLDVGLQEMNYLRERCHGRPVSLAEINAHVFPFLRSHVMYHNLHLLGVLRY